MEKLWCSSLEELPEILNIIKGDMSSVGPWLSLVEYLPSTTANRVKAARLRFWKRFGSRIG